MKWTNHKFWGYPQDQQLAATRISGASVSEGSSSLITRYIILLSRVHWAYAKRINQWDQSLEQLQKRSKKSYKSQFCHYLSWILLFNREKTQRNINVATVDLCTWKSLVTPKKRFVSSWKQRSHGPEGLNYRWTWSVSQPLPQNSSTNWRIPSSQMRCLPHLDLTLLLNCQVGSPSSSKNLDIAWSHRYRMI